jgi:RNA polymerase sigma-70 factor, ECF subfamily
MEKRLSEEVEGRFLEFLGRHEQIINKVIRIYGVDSEDRRDLFQEIVYQLWRSYGSFKGESSISTWLYRVALNTAITSLRKSKRVPELAELDDQFVHVPGSFDTPDRSEQVQQLYSAIRSLSEVDRALIMLYLEELSYKEIAEVLGLTEDNVGVKLNRIKTKLRVRIGSKIK